MFVCFVGVVIVAVVVVIVVVVVAHDSAVAFFCYFYTHFGARA